MYARLLQKQLDDALADTPVVLIVGPRRAGKTTVAQATQDQARTYITLDDQTVLEAARADPAGFVRGLEFTTIDEIQRAPELLLAIKKSIDEDYKAGRFLLTGSANVLTLPKVADSLAGRMETLTMLPLARAEVENVTPVFLEKIFDAKVPTVSKPVLGDGLVELIMLGGFPEALERSNEKRRQAWFRSYLNSVLTRDLRDIADVEKLTELPKFVRFLSEHSGQLINYSQVGSSINVTHKTAQRYVRLLEQVFLVHTLSPWHSNALKRLTKSPKLHFLDTGLLSTLRGLTIQRVAENRNLIGALLETFVLTEILKQSGASDQSLDVYHFRDLDGREVDFVLERDDGMIVGVEVKGSATVRSSDFKGLKVLQEACGDRFAYGLVLYDSATTVSFGEKLAAVPLSCLWSSE